MATLPGGGMITDDSLLALLVEARRKAGVLGTGPATMAAVSAAEAELGFSLHPLLIRVYTEVADGGIGPGYGLLPLGARAASGLRPPAAAARAGASSLCGTYRTLRTGGHENEWPRRWPEQLLPLWDWGGAIWTCLDVVSPAGDIVTHDDVAGATLTVFHLRTWLAAWVSGVDLWKEIYDDKVATILNPFTRKPVETKVRGAAKGTPWRPG